MVGGDFFVVLPLRREDAKVSEFNRPLRSRRREREEGAEFLRNLGFGA